MVLAFALPLVGACRPATQVTLELTTDAKCVDVVGTSVTVGVLGQLASRPPSAVTKSCTASSGDIGTLAIIPSDGTNDEFAIEVVTGVGAKTASECIASGYKGGCIVARRVLRFIPQQDLHLPIELEVSCIDIPCQATETCRHGSCVPPVLVDPRTCTDPAGCGADTGAMDGHAGSMNTASGQGGSFSTSTGIGGGGQGGSGGQAGSGGGAGGGGGISMDGGGTTDAASSDAFSSDVGPADAIADTKPDTPADAGADAKLDVPVDSTVGVDQGPKTCAPAPCKWTFVTSQALPNGGFGSVPMGDALCQSAAGNAQLVGTFKAWLADNADNPPRNFVHSSNPYRLLDGTLVANNWTDLSKGTLVHAISIDETGATNAGGLGLFVWTGADGTGTKLQSHCQNWTVTTGSTYQGVIGLSGFASAEWSNGGTMACGSSLGHLYCFQQ